MPAALLIAGGVSLAANAYGAKKASDASKNAARVQSQSADRAMQLQRDIYNQQRQMVNPYLQAGTQSLHAMMQQYGNAGRPMAGAPQMPAYQPMQPGGFVPPSPQMPPQQPGGPRMGGPQMGATMGSLAQMRAQPRMVMMPTPGGPRPIPEHLLPQFQAGARRLS